jgi:NAD(P)-dependent dehydrogenase (short-subunit alcohol dehydrogenase family)
MKLKPIHEQVVVIVGATSGIGLETARQFANKGAKLILSGRSSLELDSTVAQVNAEGAQAVGVVADVTQWEDIRTIALRAVEVFGRIDTWVHLPGVSVYAPFLETSPEEFKRVIEVNLIGTAYGAMAAMPFIRREGRGVVILMSSIEARVSMPYHSAYAGSKHGIDGFIKSLRIELAKDKIPICITNLMPASINTPFFDKSRTKLGVKPKPIPPVYEPREVAAAILYAAQHPVRDVVVGGAGYTFETMARVAPRLLERILLVIGFQGQKSNQEKGQGAPSNLFEHVSGFHTTHGNYPGRRSLSTWIETHPAAGFLAAGALITGISAVFAFRSHSVHRRLDP